MNLPVSVENVVLTGKRVILRPWKKEDLDDFYDYAREEGVGPMAGWLPHRDIKESEEILDRFIEGKKTFAIEYEGKAIGSLGIEEYDEEVFPEFADIACRELGFVLSKEYWGQGLMPEAVRLVLDHLFTKTGIEVLLCGHYMENTRSARVQQKCGFHHYYYGKKKNVYGEYIDHEINILTREEYMKSVNQGGNIMNINDVMHGFSITNIRPLKEISGELIEMEHLQTGAKAAWIRRKDENKTFSIGFRTIPEDDTGVFHILEHSVLNGSVKYPVREPFVDLLKGSLQTFLNAMTYPDKTVYPVSSRNDKDFINLMRVYLDAVFHPLAVTYPNVFYQEGWHYELHDPNEEPVYKGVVFNEMKGAFSSSDDVRSRLMMHQLFPDTSYGNESGGDPRYITDLTYEQFCAAHKKFYNPSNAFIALDGDMDIDTVLGIIDDEYLSHYGKEGEEIRVAEQKTHVAETIVEDYEIAPDEDPKGKAQFAYGFVTGKYDDYRRNMAFNLLSSVLCGTNESPLKKAVIDAGLAEDIFFNMQSGIYQPYVEIDVINTDIDKKEAVDDVIRKTLEEIVRNGVDKDELLATLNKEEFNAKELDFGGTPRGLVFALTAFDPWLYGGDIAESFNNDEIFSFLRENLDKGYFEGLIKDVILDSDFKAEIILRPSNTLGSEKVADEKRRLHEIKASWSREEIDEIVKMNEKLALWQASEDTPEQKATLPKLHIEDLKQTPTILPKKIGSFDGNTVITHDLDSSGISYVSLYADICDLELKDYSLLGLLNTLLGSMATENYDTLHLVQKMKSVLGSFNVSTSGYSSVRDSSIRCFSDISWSALSRNDKEACDIVREILYKTDFSDRQAIRNLVRQNKTALEQSFVSSGHSFGSARVQAFSDPIAAAGDYLGGYEYYRFLKDLEEHWDERSEEALKRMEDLYHKLFVKGRLLIAITGNNEDLIKENILTQAPKGHAGVKAELRPLGHRREGIIIPAGISFACKGAAVKDLCRRRPGTMLVLGNILTYDYLWNNVRVKGGAYGCGFACRANGFARFYSYRDPDPKHTLKVFRDTPDYLREFVAHNEDVENYIIGSMGDYDPLLSIRLMAKKSDIEYFSDIDTAYKTKVQEELIHTSVKDIEDSIGIMERINEVDDVVVIGSAKALKECEEELDDIHNL